MVRTFMKLGDHDVVVQEVAALRKVDSDQHTKFLTEIILNSGHTFIISYGGSYHMRDSQYKQLIDKIQEGQDGRELATAPR